jgi:hypothetical protein
MSKPIQNGLWIGAALAIAAAASYVATISHGIQSRPWPALIAALVVAFGTLPPLFFGRLFGNTAANQLAVVAWRMGIMLPAVAIALRFGQGERKCYLMALLTCYFVSLLLESCLLIRDVRRTQVL